MSFSTEVKQELASLHTEKSCCMLSELNALTQSCGSVSLLGQGRVSIIYRTENVTVAKRIFILLKKRLEIASTPHYYELNRFGGRKLYTIRLDTADTRKIMLSLHMISENGGNAVFRGIPRRAMTRKCCQTAFMRGLFLGEGSVSSPERDHHLEISCDSERRAGSVSKLLHQNGFSCSVTKRRNVFVVYMKRGEEISMLLGMLGASRAMLKYENLLARRTLRKAVKRATACDHNNMIRQLNASERQIDAINQLKSRGQFDTLPAELRTLAEIRLEYPELSLEEIGQMLSPPLGKSGVSHRFQKIRDQADRLTKL